MWEKLGNPIQPYKIVSFRILFGIVLLFQAIYFIQIDFIKNDLVDPLLHFPYPYLEFITVASPVIMNGLLNLLIISSIMIIVGIYSRLFFLFYFIAFTYMWLIDKGFYNNHYYLLSILLLLMSIIRSDGKLAIIKDKKQSNKRWELFLLLFQFSVVLIYAGLNKLNYWWLIQNEPITHILQAKASISGNLIWQHQGFIYFLVYGGVLFDLFIVPLLFWKKTRLVATFLFVLFNAINTWIFYDIGEIGIFPLLMLSSLVLFYPSDSIRAGLRRFIKLAPDSISESKTEIPISLHLKIGLMFFVIFQMSFPLRHHLFKGNVDYTGEGQRFSWRMKAVYKDFDVSFILKDEKRGISAELDPRAVLTIKQYTNLGYYPELIFPVAANLREAAIEKGVEDPKIYVKYKVGFMGLPKQEMIDTTRLLSSMDYAPFRHSDWILPLYSD